MNSKLWKQKDIDSMLSNWLIFILLSIYSYFSFTYLLHVNYISSASVNFLLCDFCNIYSCGQYNCVFRAHRHRFSSHTRALAENRARDSVAAKCVLMLLFADEKTVAEVSRVLVDRLGFEPLPPTPCTGSSA